jgi:hypothetical protein
MNPLIPNIPPQQAARTGEPDRPNLPITPMFGRPEEGAGAAASASLLAADRLQLQAIDGGPGHRLIYVWVASRQNGWTPCREHRHLTPEAASACFRSAVARLLRSAR